MYWIALLLCLALRQYHKRAVSFVLSFQKSAKVHVIKLSRTSSKGGFFNMLLGRYSFKLVAFVVHLWLKPLVEFVHKNLDHVYFGDLCKPFGRYNIKLVTFVTHLLLMPPVEFSACF